MRDLLLLELEKHVAVAEARGGCPILFAIEISSAVHALEGIGVMGDVEICGEALPVDASRASEKMA